MGLISAGRRYPDISELSPIAALPTHVTAVVNFLDRVSYKLMRTAEDRAAVFKIRHDAYSGAGHIDMNESGLFEDTFDQDPSFFNIGVFVDEELVACLRLNCLMTGCSGSPTLVTHRGLLTDYLDRGLRITDSTRFCAAAALADRHKLLPFAVIRLSGLHAAHFQTSMVASSVQNRHLPFYTRFLGAKAMEEDESVSTGLTMRVRLTLADINEIRRSCYVDRQFFFSTPAERQALFEGAAGTLVTPSVRDVVFKGANPDFWF